MLFLDTWLSHLLLIFTMMFCTMTYGFLTISETAWRTMMAWKQMFVRDIADWSICLLVVGSFEPQVRNPVPSDWLVCPGVHS